MNKYNSLREKISAEKAEREARYALFAQHWETAWKAGEMAAHEARPRPMVVMDGTGRQVDYVPDGVCGFAWLNVPGNTSFGRWIKKQGIAGKDYTGGLSVWISAYEQSHIRKAAHAYAMARYLQSQGIQCHARSRLD